MSERPPVEAVIVDYGGVLTSSIGDTMAAFCADADLDPKAFGAIMREWLGPGETDNPMRQLERGEIEALEFETALAERLETRSGMPVEAAGLLVRMFAGSIDLPELVGALHKAKLTGRKIGLLSNSWGNSYPIQLWQDLFDDLVISGEVGMRKPDAEIFTLAASRLGVQPEACVFVDDVKANVNGAVSVGMIGILHTDPTSTIVELEALLGTSLS